MHNQSVRRELWTRPYAHTSRPSRSSHPSTEPCARPSHGVMNVLAARPAEPWRYERPSRAPADQAAPRALPPSRVPDRAVASRTDNRALNRAFASRTAQPRVPTDPWTSTAETVNILSLNRACGTIQNSFKQSTHNSQFRKLNHTCPCGKFDLDHLDHSMLYTLGYGKCVLHLVIYFWGRCCPNYVGYLTIFFCFSPFLFKLHTPLI